ncbi:MAG: hypothetical protein HKP30_11675, partial [Myxococcales bacterium]|nr:hypothetical protein [Myxococcales bacterium]
LRVRVDLAEHRVVSLADGDRELLAEPPALALWRAPLDNDGMYGQGAVGRWREWGLDSLSLASRSATLRRQDGTALLRLDEVWHGATPALAISHRQRLVLDGDGLHFAHEVRVPKALDDLPRVGVQLVLPAGHEDVEWFGLGPHENYVDRRDGVFVARHRGSVADLYHPYVRPQSQGARGETRWLALRAKDGSGIGIVADAPLAFAARHFSEAELERAQHLAELEPDPRLHVYLDVAQRGVGTGACGPDTLPRYRVGGGRFRFGYRIVGLSAGASL